MPTRRNEPEKKRCPHCGALIDRLSFDASYTETVFGRCWGSADLDGCDTEISDSEQRDSDNWETDDYEYKCPECDAGVSPEDLLDPEVAWVEGESDVAVVEKPKPKFGENSLENFKMKKAVD